MNCSTSWRPTRKSATDRETFEALIRKIRERVPDMIIRTTVMTGFPGETDEQFEELAEFVKTCRFDNLGCFAFSPEEGTASTTSFSKIIKSSSERL